jgi:hypothetical protein
MWQAFEPASESPSLYRHSNRFLALQSVGLVSTIIYMTTRSLLGVQKLDVQGTGALLYRMW